MTSWELSPNDIKSLWKTLDDVTKEFIWKNSYDIVTWNSAQGGAWAERKILASVFFLSLYLLRFVSYWHNVSSISFEITLQFPFPLTGFTGWYGSWRAARRICQAQNLLRVIESFCTVFSLNYFILCTLYCQVWHVCPCPCVDFTSTFRYARWEGKRKGLASVCFAWRSHMLWYL